MAALGKYLRTLEGNRLAFWCPACDGVHQIRVSDPAQPNSGWSFNNNPDAPTFSPSVKVTGRSWTKAGKAAHDAWVEAGRPHDATGSFQKFESMDTCCHFFVQDGKINYCGDCTHEMNGKQGVPMLEWDQAMPRDFSLGGDL